MPSDKVGVFKRFRKDREFRLSIFAICSIITTSLFASYMAYVGISKGSIWHCGMSAYYAVLAVIRIVLVLCNKYSKEEKIPKVLHVTKIMLLVLDSMLLIPAAMMLLKFKQIKTDMISVNINAFYTAYKVTISIINLIRCRKRYKPIYIELKKTNFIDAMVSAMSLQNTYIILVFGNKNMRLTTPTLIYMVFCDLVFIALSILITCLPFKRACNNLKQKNKVSPNTCNLDKSHL